MNRNRLTHWFQTTIFLTSLCPRSRKGCIIGFTLLLMDNPNHLRARLAASNIWLAVFASTDHLTLCLHLVCTAPGILTCWPLAHFSRQMVLAIGVASASYPSETGRQPLKTRGLDSKHLDGHAQPSVPFGLAVPRGFMTHQAATSSHFHSLGLPPVFICFPRTCWGVLGVSPHIRDLL